MAKKLGPTVWQVQLVVEHIVEVTPRTKKMLCGVKNSSQGMNKGKSRGLAASRR